MPAYGRHTPPEISASRLLSKQGLAKWRHASTLPIGGGDLGVALSKAFNSEYVQLYSTSEVGVPIQIRVASTVLLAT